MRKRDSENRMTTKPETETTITWTAEDERAEVYSLMPRIWRACIAAGGEEIKQDQGIRNGRKVARTFLVPIRAIRIRKQRKLSEKELRQRREQGRRLAASRMGLDTKENA